MTSERSVDPWTLGDLCTPWCVHVVVTLKVAEHIAAGRSALPELAAACGAHEEFLGRVLRHLVGQGLFEEPHRDVFALNAPAHALLEPGVRLGFDLDGFGGRMAGAWSTLLAAVRGGEARYADVFGRPFWDDLDAHPEVAAQFDDLMGPLGHGMPDARVLLDDDWSSVRTVVDVGGGTGTLLAEILRARPALRGILVDLPRAVARADQVFSAAGVSDRAQAVAQSFFEPLPAGAELCLLKSVLSDWPDADAERLLRRCAEAVSPSGRVVVLSGVLPDDPPPPALLMLVLVGGQERSLAEFTALAARAGLAVRRSGRAPSGRFVVECTPLDATR